MTAKLETNGVTLPTPLLLSFGALLLYPFVKIVYNLYFHPLKKIPGPGSWSCSRLPFVWALLKGTLIHDIERLHRKYGPVLRIAPDEVTFAKAEAYNDIFHSRPDHQVFLKDLVWWKRQPGHPDSLISAVNPDKHARIRRALTPAFTPLALKAQEPILQKYVDLLVAKLEEQVDQGISGEGFDISPWMHFTTFDIFGDLGFGESFNCLQHSEFHPWISILFNSVKAATYVAAARFYPIIEFMLMACIPPSLRKMQRDHYQLIADKVHRRMNWEMERPDIMSHVIQQQSVEKSLSIGEIEATFMILTTAGSETSATTLTGAIHYLTRCPEKLAILTTELSQTFQSRNQITLDILQNLPYINAVLQEALRLCPPLPWILPRRVPIGGGSVCGIQLPGGTPVSIQAWSINRDPDYFHRAASFEPERWLPEALDNASSPYHHDHRQALQPFSVGPRNCIGKHLGLAQSRLILANLVWHFDIGAVEGERLRWEELRTFLLVEKKPVKIQLKRRVL